MNLPAELRTWRLLKLGVSLTEQADMPAVQLDWLLAIDETVNEVRAERERG